jgi:hypothetical protein
MAKCTLGDREWARYKKIQEENLKLKEEVRKLRRIIQHANLDNKMDTKKKTRRKLQREKEAIKDKIICPNCKIELKQIPIPRLKKTLLICKQCSHRETILD